MIRIIDIAKHTGLSRITVSGVLNGRYTKMGISEATAERVRRGASELGYVRNEVSLAMKTGKSTTIGCIITSLGLEWGGKTLEGALSAVGKTDYSIRLSSGLDFKDEHEVLHDFLAGRVAGIFFCNVNPSFNTTRQIHTRLASYGIPFVSNNCSPNFSQHEVEADNPGATAMAVKHLADLGHQRIAFIGGDDTFVAQQRLNGFISSMQENGLPIHPGYLQTGDWQVEPTIQATRYLLRKLKKAPTAIVSANHFMAAATLRTASQLGYNVPRDLSVVGITDETLCQITDPPMTTVCIAEREIGRLCMEMLIGMINDSSKCDKPVLKIVPTSLKVRESTAPPK